MPELPDASSSPSTDRCLVIAETIEAAYRYAAADSRETEIVLAAADGTFEQVAGTFGRVIVVGFANDPAVLGALVEQAFAHAQVVSVGASSQTVAGSSDAWSAAFASVRAVGVAEGPFPAVEIVQEPGTGTGEFVRGALSVLAQWEPRPDLRPVLTTPPTSDKAPPKLDETPASITDRARRLVTGFVKSHRRLVVAAAGGALVAVAVTVGLIALLDQYAVGVLVLVVLLLLVLSVLLQELRGHRLQAAINRIDTRSAALRDLAPPAKPATLAQRLESNADDLNALIRSLSVVELASVDAAKTLARLESAVDAERGGRA